VRVLCGTDRPRPCATSRPRTRESLISRTVAYRRAQSVQPGLRMAFKRLGVRLPSGPPSHFTNRHDLRGIFALSFLIFVRRTFIVRGERRQGEVDASRPGNLDRHLSAGWALGCGKRPEECAGGRPGIKEATWGTARASLRPGDVRRRVGAWRRPARQDTQRESRVPATGCLATRSALTAKRQQPPDWPRVEPTSTCPRVSPTVCLPGTRADPSLLTSRG
jgi:hypothetical protein